MNLVKEMLSSAVRLVMSSVSAFDLLSGRPAACAACSNPAAKTVRVAVFTLRGAQADAAREAGADIVGSDDLVADIQAVLH